jgi:2-(3-amino-3-carboxypropyl)histidine synthase
LKTFDFEEERLKREITKLEAKTVLLQLPEGLKPEAICLARRLQKLGILPVISADPCYGACDLALQDAESLGIDLIIHFGHTKMVKHERIPTLYIEARANLDIEKSVEKTIPLLENYGKIGLVTTVQHVHMLEKAKEILLESGKTVAIGDSGKLPHAGQVIGCDYSNAKAVAKEVEAFLFLGGGRFHAIGVELATRKPTIVANPYQKTAFTIEKEAKKIVNQRWAAIEEAKEAKNFGVLLGLKTGQKQMETALILKEKLSKAGKSVFLLAIREITPEALLQFPTLEAYVNTACPRVGLDETSKFHKPVLTPKEAAVVLGEKSWEQLCSDGWFGN